MLGCLNFVNYEKIANFAPSPEVYRLESTKALLQYFRSVKRLREASEADIAAVIGPTKAKIVTAGLLEF